MAANAEKRMNLASLQQRDPFISGIVETASQVALYIFKSESQEWEKTEIEGTLFVYTRSASPVNGFMILNRLGLNDLIEPLTPRLEFQIQDPFLLYRNPAGLIFGIWFYDVDECAKIGQLMNSLVQISLELSVGEEMNSIQGMEVRSRASDGESNHPPKAHSEKAPKLQPDSGKVDIVEMLSKAQDEYKAMVTQPIAPHQPSPKLKKKSTSPRSNPKPKKDGPSSMAPQPIRPNGASAVVRPVPVKYSHGLSTAVPSAPGGGTHISLATLFQTASHTQYKSKTDTDEQRPLQNLFERIMSTKPVVSLEHIEQTSVTLASPDSPNTSIKKSLKLDKVNVCNPSSLSTITNLNKTSVSAQLRAPDPSALPTPSLTGTPKTPDQKIRQSAAPRGQGDTRREQHGVPRKVLSPVSSKSSPCHTPPTSVLLTPMAFKTATGAVSGTSRQSQTKSNQSDTREDIRPTPLTKQQLQQALIHLIKNDERFVLTLHQAYLESFQHGLSRSHTS